MDILDMLARAEAWPTVQSRSPLRQSRDVSTGVMTSHGFVWSLFADVMVTPFPCDDSSDSNRRLPTRYIFYAYTRALHLSKHSLDNRISYALHGSTRQSRSSGQYSKSAGSASIRATACARLARLHSVLRLRRQLLRPGGHSRHTQTESSRLVPTDGRLGSAHDCQHGGVRTHVAECSHSAPRYGSAAAQFSAHGLAS